MNLGVGTARPHSTCGDEPSPPRFRGSRRECLLRGTLTLAGDKGCIGRGGDAQPGLGADGRGVEPFVHEGSVSEKKWRG